MPHNQIVDVTGVGINATDTIIELPRFPKFNSKLELCSAAVYPGGQVASALVACRRWGLSPVTSALSATIKPQPCNHVNYSDTASSPISSVYATA